MLRRGGEARPRQSHQLRVGTARVEACKRIRKVGPLRLAVQLRTAFAHERRLAGEDLAEDRAKGEDVRPLVERVERARACSGAMYDGVPSTDPGRDSIAADPLRKVQTAGRVAAGKDRLLLVGHTTLVEHLRQTPVHDLHLAEAADHDVRRLQVPVDHAPSMGVGHGLTDLLEDREEAHPVLVGTSARREQRRQSSAPDQLHRDEQPAIGEPPQLVDGDDPGVLELATDLGLLHEAADHLGVIAVLLPDHFDGEIPAQVEVAPLEDRAHPAPRQFADQLVTRRLPRELGRLG